MTALALRRPLRLIAMAGVLAVPAPTSDPIGVYAVVEKVVLAPNAENPATIQVWGTFAVSDQKPGDNYRPAVKGYLFYAVNSSNERATRAEWGDLAGLAGKKVIAGFGTKWSKVPLGRVRCATETPGEPDVYPLGLGVMRMPEQRNTGWELEKSVLSASAPAAPCAKGK